MGMGVGPTGEVTIAFAGGDDASNMYRCGGSDMMTTTRPAGGAFGAPVTILTGSGGTTLATSQAAACVQGVCSKGDTTGMWPSVAYDKSGTPSIAFQDVHFGFAKDDFGKSDAEFSRGAELLTIDVAKGGGYYNRLAYRADGKAVLGHYNQQGDATDVGLWVNNELSSTDWSRTFVASPLLNGPFGFDVSASGTYAFAYYDTGAKKLQYIESTDNGATWTAPTDVDTDGDVGRFPSLAFAPDGEPAVSYYRCNDFDPNKNSCDPNRDGLRYAHRKAGKWNVSVVSSVASISDGMNSWLAFVGGKAVIAYQTLAFDPSSGKSTAQLNVAKEK
jgi:hypothetical protein